jgi:putative ABC transport system ATP-binding protein
MAAIIETAGLGRTYSIDDRPVPALQGVDLTVQPGELLAIMGPSGSGKSTLMNLLGLLDTPTAGSYLLAGTRVDELDSDAKAKMRSRNIGFVFQSFNLLPRATAVENVELPLVYAGVPAAERRQRALEALEHVQLSKRATHWPRQLSGGEQQRVAIARAIVNNPALILADEPTGALDSRTGTAILALFQRLNREGRTIIMVTHDTRVARHCARNVVLRDGCLQIDARIEGVLDARDTSETAVKRLAS